MPDTAPDILGILDRLIGFDTTSERSNLALMGYVEALLADAGASVRRIPDPVLDKASLWVTIGPADRPGYVLSGHTDTVPVTGQRWTSDPYRMVERDGRVYGRGAVDMKGFVAVCLAMVPRMVGAKLARPIHLAISYDEEVGCTGVKPMLEAVSRLAVRPLGCFVGEPTEMQTVIGHKSKHSLRVTVRGKACHSALTSEGVNAVEAAAEFIMLVKAKAEALARGGARDAMHVPPYTTGLTTIVEGGIANNIVPDRCEIELEFRGIAADDPRAICLEVMEEARRVIEPWMRARDPQAGFTAESVVDYPALETAPDHPVARLAQQLSGKPGWGRPRTGRRRGCSTRWPAFPRW